MGREEAGSTAACRTGPGAAAPAPQLDRTPSLPSENLQSSQEAGKGGAGPTQGKGGSSREAPWRPGLAPDAAGKEHLSSLGSGQPPKGGQAGPERV